MNPTDQIQIPDGLPFAIIAICLFLTFILLAFQESLLIAAIGVVALAAEALISLFIVDRIGGKV